MQVGKVLPADKAGTVAAVAVAVVGNLGTDSNRDIRAAVAAAVAVAAVGNLGRDSNRDIRAAAVAVEAAVGIPGTDSNRDKPAEAGIHNVPVLGHPTVPTQREL